MFSVVLVKCSDWVFIRELSVSTVSTKCEIAILQCQHTQTISGLCFFFIGKDIQVFLVFRISAFCSWTCWTGIINTKRNPLFEVVIFASCTFLMNPELPKWCCIQIQQGQVHLLYRKIKSSVLQEIDATISEIGSPQIETGELIKQ